MVLAAGLGTRLRPITYEVAKPMVPVLDRPVMAHIVDLLERSGVEEIVANLHHFPDAVRGYRLERDGSFVPEAPAGSRVGAAQINDVYVDENRLVYAVDRFAGGLYVLEMTI